MGPPWDCVARWALSGTSIEERACGHRLHSNTQRVSHRTASPNASSPPDTRCPPGRPAGLTGLVVGSPGRSQQAAVRRTRSFGFQWVLVEGARTHREGGSPLGISRSHPSWWVSRPSSLASTSSRDLWWWPLALPGPLRCGCRWPDRGIAETSTTVDAGELRHAPAALVIAGSTRRPAAAVALARSPGSNICAVMRAETSPGEHRRRARRRGPERGGSRPMNTAASGGPSMFGLLLPRRDGA